MTFKEFLDKVLPEIDRAFTQRGEPLPMRPLMASQFVVDHCIVEVEGGKEDYMGKEWFAHLYAEVFLWFAKRYGSALAVESSDDLKSIIEFGGVMLPMAVPATVSGPEKDPELQWLEFPTRILDHENPREWLLKQPNFKGLSRNEAEELDARVRARATEIRVVAGSLMHSKTSGQHLEQLAASIVPHLNSCANLFLHPHGAQMRGIEELHFAVEKILKLLIAQRTGSSPPKGHSLVDLEKELKGTGLDLGVDSDLKQLPHWNEVNQHRYGELPPVGSKRLMEMYDAAMSILSKAVKHLEQNEGLKDKRIVIRKLPWAKELQKRMSKPNAG